MRKVTRNSIHHGGVFVLSESVARLGDDGINVAPQDPGGVEGAAGGAGRGGLVPAAGEEKG